jgi:hypothetical protein
MNNNTVSGIHWSFWAIGAVALIWNAMGVMNYVMQMDTNALASYPESHRSIIEGRPAWATGAFAIAVFGGVLGCLLLLLRKSAALYLFVASLLGVIVTMVHTLRVANLTADFSPFEISMMIVMPMVVAAFLIWYSIFTEKKGWIN